MFKKNIHKRAALNPGAADITMTGPKSSKSHHEKFFRIRSADLILTFFLAISSLKLVNLYENVVDLGLCGESSYLQNGVELIKRGLPSSQYSPLYSVWYFLLSRLPVNNLQLYYLNYKALIFLTTILIYIYSRRLKVMPQVSAVVSFLYLISGIHLVNYYVGYFALLVLLLFLIFTTFAESREWFYCVLGTGFLVVSFVKPEYFVAFSVNVSLWTVFYALFTESAGF